MAWTPTGNISAGQKGDTGDKGDKGDTGNPTDWIKTGTGFPEGVVVAPVGATYIDTAATNGAQQWIKKTGTYTTGWDVSVGDTGWRDITGLLDSNWTAEELNLKRTAERVYLQAYRLSGPSTNGQTPFVIPWSFRAGLDFDFMVNSANSIGAPVMSMFRGGGGATYIGTSAKNNISSALFEISWSCVQAWPSGALPGVPK